MNKNTIVYYVGLLIVVSGLPLGFYDITLANPPMIFILIPVATMIIGLSLSITILYHPIYPEIPSSRSEK